MKLFGGNELLAISLLARVNEYEFKTWLEETKITKLEWMIEADIIY